MTDYTKLVAALRNNDWSDACPCCDEAMCKDADCIILQAADAIEALQAENPIVETVLLDKMRQQMEETVCHCNVKENAELIARILDDDVDGKAFAMSKRGEVVRCGECRYRITAHGISDGWVLCSKPYTERGNSMHRADWFCADGEREVQDADS